MATLELDELVAGLNDEFRGSLGMGVLPGTVVMTRGIEALGKDMVAEILLRIVGYDFAAEGHWSEKRRMGVLDIAGVAEKVLWRIFCYADDRRELEVEGSERGDYRVMEIGLASEVCC